MTKAYDKIAAGLDDAIEGRFTMNSKVYKWKIRKDADDDIWRVYKVEVDHDNKETKELQGLNIFKSKQDAETHLLKMGVGFTDRLGD